MKTVRVGLSVGVLVLAAACSKKDAEQPPKDFSNPALPAQPVPAKFAIADFQTLRYLEGTWRGTQDKSNSFYESYHFVNDSTILQASHTDSTFKTKSDSAFIMFRNGAVIDSNFSSGKMVTAEKLESGVVDFRASPTYHFTWSPDGKDGWKASIYNQRAAGGDTLRVYPMKRIRK